MAVNESSPLRGKQQVFVDNYFLCDFNGTEAAAKSGYKGNRQTLAAIASENLSKPHIQAAIQARMREKTMQADEVLYRLSKMATATMADFLEFSNDRGGHENKVEIDLHRARGRGALGLIRDLEINETVVSVEDAEQVLARKVKIKLHDAKDALKTLARFWGLDGGDTRGTAENPLVVATMGLEEKSDDELKKSLAALATAAATVAGVGRTAVPGNGGDAGGDGTPAKG